MYGLYFDLFGTTDRISYIYTHFEVNYCNIPALSVASTVL